MKYGYFILLIMSTCVVLGCISDSNSQESVENNVITSDDSIKEIDVESVPVEMESNNSSKKEKCIPYRDDVEIQFIGINMYYNSKTNEYMIPTVHLLINNSGNCTLQNPEISIIPLQKNFNSTPINIKLDNKVSKYSNSYYRVDTRNYSFSRTNIGNYQQDTFKILTILSEGESIISNDSMYINNRADSIKDSSLYSIFLIGNLKNYYRAVPEKLNSKLYPLILSEDNGNYTVKTKNFAAVNFSGVIDKQCYSNDRLVNYEIAVFNFTIASNGQVTNTVEQNIHCEQTVFILRSNDSDEMKSVVESQIKTIDIDPSIFNKNSGYCMRLVSLIDGRTSTSCSNE